MWNKKNKYKMISNKNAELIKKSVVNSVLYLDGDIAEVGVSIGDSAEVICEAKKERRLHLFDTFEGHPKEKIGKYDLSQTEGKHYADIEEVKKRLSKFPNVYFYKGIFPDTSEPIKDKKFCLVNLDTDLYQSTYEGLEFFTPRMVEGGIIIVHDTPIPGVSCAIIDFFATHQEKVKEIKFLEGTNQAFIGF